MPRPTPRSRPGPLAPRAGAHPLVPVAFALAALAAGADEARAYDVEINSETIGQGYQIVGADGGVISRRRLDQYLGLNVFNLGPKDATGAPLAKNQWYFASSMRLQFDFGDYPPPNNQWGGRDTFQEIANNRFELLYAYFGGRDLGGFLDLRLGRQIDYDNLTFLSYDGINLLAKTPFYLAAELYGGLQVNGYLPVDSPILRPDGTSQGVLSIHDRDPKPLIGVGLRTFGFRDLDARLSFRQVFAPGSGACNTNTSDANYYGIGNIERCARLKDGTSEQALSFTARGRLLDGAIVPWVGLRYDFLNNVFDTVQAGLRFTIKRDHGLTLEYLYSYPTFDGDSIFNLFARSEFNDLRAGYDLRAGRLRLYGRGFARFFNDVQESVDRLSPSLSAPVAPGGSIDGGANLGARVDFGQGYLRADGYLEYGYGGHKVGGDLSSRFRVYQEILALEGRVTVVDFADDARPQNSATSLGLQLGGRAMLTRGILLHVIIEDNINRFYPSQVRLYGVLDITALLGSNGAAMAPPRGMGPGMGQFGSAYGYGRGY